MISESEWKTRKDRIDKKLTSLTIPWKIIKYVPSLDISSLSCHAVEEYPTANGPADYALFVKGKLLGIIEAKKVSVNPQNVLEQAKRYSKGAFGGTGNWEGYRVPFLYSSNGEIIYHIDVRDEKNLSRTISTFHTSEALEELFERNLTESYQWLEENPVNIDRLYEFQKTALDKIEESIRKRKRKMLVAMATGTGKTFTTVAQIYRLLKSKVAKRILFLVDRRALAAQAVREFASFVTPAGNKFNQEYEVYSQKFQREDFDEDTPFDPKTLPESYLTSPKSIHTFIYVCTIQRMAINLLGRESSQELEGGTIDIDGDEKQLDIPIHAFDIIIADECHRGYTAKETGKWLKVIDHFDAIKIGLTATPASHTLSLFTEVVFRYSMEEAIQEGYLVDYDVVCVKSDVKIKGAFLREGEQVGFVDTETGVTSLDELEDEREFSSSEIEDKITIPDSNRKIIKEIALYASKHEEVTGRFPKILIFAVNDLPHTSHADQLVKICREEFSRGDDFVQKITGNPNVDRPLQRIREFRNRPKPGIVVTVDMLSTGVDIPSIEFIVFLRPVKSRILWVQMLGRGTRLCPEINKTNFVIFDCFGGSLIEYFKNTTDFIIEPPQKDAIPLEQIIENIYNNVDRGYNIKILVKRLRRIHRNMSGEARELFAAYIDDGNMKKFADELPQKIENDFVTVMQLLKNKDFQYLLLNYPRAKRSFLIGYDTVDDVSSNMIIHAGNSYLKPEDYIESFERFIRKNPDHIEAIQVILERPKEWKTEVLNDLRKKLTQSKFPEKELQKAHKLVYGKDLADIISIIRHAFWEQEPIYTSEERIDNAIQKVIAGKSLDEEQMKWMGLIREHLVKNLTIEMEDFESIPIFSRAGGLGKIRTLFKDDLSVLIAELNAAIAS